MRLPKKTSVLWLIRLSFIILLFALILYSTDILPKNLYWPTAAALTAACSAIFIFLPLHFKSYAITVDEAFITIERGVFFRSKYLIPKAFALIKVFRTPLTRRMGLWLVAVKAIKRWIIIPELEKDVFLGEERVISHKNGI